MELRAARRPALYGAVGVLNTAVGLGGYTVGLAVLHLSVLASLLVGHVASVSVGFPLHRRTVFQIRGTGVVRDFVRWEAVTGGSAVVNAVLLALAVVVLKAPHLAAEVCVTALLAGASYVAHRDFSFARRPCVATEGKPWDA